MNRYYRKLGKEDTIMVSIVIYLALMGENLGRENLETVTSIKSVDGALLASQLLGAGGDIKEGEGARKRLKISVPHFDNYALVKTYSKTIIGRYLGHGKFQFDFQTEEEIEAVLKLQPYHFDYWMVALARWQSKKDGNGGWQEGGKHADRARSYKGVVINGNTGYQQKERDGRDYYGKGKGKMGEETDFKWVRAAEKGNKGSANNRGSYRGDGEASRQRMPRREDSRMAVQERSSRGVSGPIGDQQLQRGSNVKATENKAVEAPEEGEIKVVEASNQQLPSQTFQEELAKTQAIGTEVISDPMDAESGLQVIQSLVGDSSTLNEDKVMDMDEIREVFLANGIDMDAVDELQECSEGEVEEAMRELDRAGNEDIHEDEALVTAVDGKGMTDVEMAKQHGTRKRLFKPAAGTAVSTKMRMASVRASPRKRTGVKSGMRQGENSKQMDAKGTSNPKPGLPKP
ncbi:hypothetical protein Bca101_091198 [Brassica carinata]